MLWKNYTSEILYLGSIYLKTHLVASEVRIEPLRLHLELFVCLVYLSLSLTSGDPDSIRVMAAGIKV